jgi:hypothetical protein
MRDRLAIRNFTSETVDWEKLILIVLFKDTHDAGNSFCVSILLSSWVYIMKRLRFTRITIRECEVNSDMNVDFTTSEDVIQETLFPPF